MARTKDSRLISLLVIVALLLPLVAMPADALVNGGTYLNITGNVVKLWCEENTGTADPWISATLVDDLDGDGKPDVLVIMGAGPLDNKTYTVIAKKGNIGRHLWQESFTGYDTSVVAEETGDLNGDGRADVLVIMWEGPWPNRTVTLIAKKGNDGSHLWQESFTGYDTSVVAEETGDLDGDGRADVLVVMGAGPSDNRTCTVIAKNGTGEHLWQETITGCEAAMFIYMAGDLDGDGKADVLVNTSEGPWPNRTYTVIAKKGSNGSHLWSENVSPPGAGMYLGVAGDLDGDGKADVLVRTTEGPSDNRTYTVIAKNGTGEHLWQETITGDAVYMDAYLVGDLDGDGRPDVIVNTYLGPLANRTATVIAKKGSNGSHLWEESFTGNNASVRVEEMGDFDGDGKADVLVRTTVGQFESGSTITLIAKKGNDGSHLWQESFTGYYTSVLAEETGDLDGDGKADVLVVMATDPFENRTATVIAKRGNSGSHLWQESIAGPNAHINAYLIGDLDGDGRPDVIVEMYLGPSETMTATIIAKKGNSGSHLWQESITSPNPYRVNACAIDDFDCDGKTDVLVMVGVGGGQTQPVAGLTAGGLTDGSQLIAKKGTNGAHLWQAESDGLIRSIVSCGGLMNHSQAFGGTHAAIDGSAVLDGELDGRVSLSLYDGYGYFDDRVYDLNGDGKDDIVIWAANRVCALASQPCGVPLLVPPSELPPKPGVSPSMPGPPRKPNPALLSTQYLSVYPQQTYAGQPVAISTNVVNNGDETGNYNVVLRINGQTEQSKMVSVGPQGSQPVKFTVSKAQPGTYKVIIDGQQSSFTILGLDGAASSSSRSGGLIAFMLIGVLILAAVLVLMLAFRRPA